MASRHSSANRRMLTNREEWSEANKRSRSYTPNVEMFYIGQPARRTAEFRLPRSDLRRVRLRASLPL